jgi:hypothetical protein
MALTIGIGGAVAGGVGLIGNIMGAGAAKKAGDQQADAIRSGIQFQTGQLNDAKQNLAPYIGTGTNALSAISQIYGLPAPEGSTLPAGNALESYSKFAQTPFYTFPLSQGIEARERAATSKGLSLSGGQLNALQNYSQDYASGNFGKYIEALSGLANIGQSSSVQLGQLGNSASGNVLQGQTGVGNALAAGTIGQQSAINKGLSYIPQLLGYGDVANNASGNSGSSFGSVSDLIRGLTGGGGYVDNGQWTQ